MNFAGEEGGLTAAAAVAAQNDWAQWGYEDRADNVEITLTSPESYLLATTPVLAAGVYRIVATFILVGSAAGTDIEAILEIDGSPFGTLLQEANVANGAFVLTTSIPSDFTAGDATHTIELLAAKPASPGMLFAVFATIEWQRKE